MLVVVPAHNEEHLLGACLDSLHRAASRVAMSVQIVVVLDACTDATASVVGARVHTVTVNRHNVGAARAAGFAATGAGCAAETWFATTDADTVVEPNWLAHQLHCASTGTQLVVGTVRVADWQNHPVRVRESYAQAYHAAGEHRHIHGANLGVRADTYWAAGGFTALATGEDVDLVQRVSATGARVSWVADAPVRTSSRVVGRAPDGFAAHLRALGATGLRPASHPTGALT